MTFRQTEFALASKVKQILEQETGDTYVLKSGSQLIEDDGTLWFLHPTIDRKPRGRLSHAYQKGEVVTLETPVVYDVRKRLDFEYRKALERGESIHDMDKLNRREARRKYSHRFPRIMAFFDKADEFLLAMRKSTGINVVLSPGNGWVSFQVEIPAARISEDETVITESVAALEKLVGQIYNWLDDERIRHESRRITRTKDVMRQPS